MTFAQVLPFAALGWIGALHCAGMCGPLLVAAGLVHGRGGALAVHALGKALMYAVLALLVAGTLERLGSAGPFWLTASRAAAAWLAGLTLIVAGLSQAGWIPDSPRRWLAPLAGAVKLAWRGAGELRGLPRAFALGAANGLLPCGLSWSAIALAAACPQPITLVGPLVFGLATLPGLALFALLGARVPARWRARLHTTAAIALCLYGAWTALRGVVLLAPGAGAPLVPECCSSQPTSPQAERASGR